MPRQDGQCRDWTHLPGVVMSVLVSTLENSNQYSTVYAVRATCRKWRERVSENLGRLRLNYVLDLSGMGNEFKRLRELDLGLVTTSGALEGVSTFQGLQGLTLNGLKRGSFKDMENIDEGIAEVLVKLPFLERIQGLVCSSRVLESIFKLDRLRSIVLHNFDTSNDGGVSMSLNGITALQNLTSLAFIRSKFGLELLCLRGCPNLKSLALDSCGSIHYSHVGAPVHLKEVIVRNTFLNLVFLENLEHIEKIVISAGNGSTGLGYYRGLLPKTASLRQVSMHCLYRFDASDCDPRFSNLTHLDMLFTNGLLESNMLNHVALPNLVTLSLNCCGIIDEQFHELTLLTRLKSLVLHVGQSELSPFGALCLMELTGMTRLQFYPNASRFNPECMRYLYESLPYLTEPMDFGEVVDDMKERMSGHVYSATWEMGVPGRVTDSKLGGLPLMLHGEKPVTCTRCSADMMLVFQMNFGSIPDDFKPLFGQFFMQFFTCGTCPLQVRLRIIPLRLIDKCGAKICGSEHALPWGTTRNFLRPYRLGKWEKSICRHPSCPKSRETMERLGVDVDLVESASSWWRTWPYDFQDCRIGGQVTQDPSDWYYTPVGKVSALCCPMCGSEMDMVAVKTRPPVESNVFGNLGVQSIVIQCCPFHHDQFAWQSRNVQCRGELVELPE